MLKRIVMWVSLALALSGMGSALADADPTNHQIYEAAQAGHLDQAQQMINQVLRDHPNSAKAHYVAAELDARRGALPQAREELNTAERLEPGLPFATPQAVQALKSELGLRGGQVLPGSPAMGTSFPWGIAIAVFGGIVVLWMIMRRRRAMMVPTYAGGVPAGGAPAGYGGPGYGGPGYGPGAGGIGSGIAGGLASGLAVGAGVVAGEELAHHLLDGDRRPAGEFLPQDNSADFQPNQNMGGSDFGITDGGSWDDGGSSGGGDDWS